MQNQLEQAYNLIQQERMDEAVALLRPIVQVAPNNPDAWWLLANAVSDPTDAYDALGHVLRLEPNHEDAQELLDNLLEDYPELGAARPSSGMTSPGAAQASWDASFGDSGDAAFGGSVVNDPRRISSRADAIDDMFSVLNTTQPDIGFDTDFQTRTASSFDDNYMRSSSIARPSGTAANSAFGGDDEDIFASGAQTTDEDLFAIGSKSAPPPPAARPQQPVADDSDLDALFGTTPKRVNPDTAFDFGSGDPSFLSAMDGEPTMRDEKRSTRTGRKTNTAARPIPAQDPFAAEAKANRRNPLLPLLAVLLLLGVIAAVGYFAVVRPTQTTPTQVAVNSTAAVTADAGGVVDIAALIELTKSRFSAANFANPEATFVDQTFTVKTCEKPGRTLRQRIFEAMDLIGSQVAQVRKDVSKVSLEFTDCSRPTVRLYRASAPIDAVTTYVDGGLTDSATYRAAWATN
jgi:hypothetical protein